MRKLGNHDNQLDLFVAREQQYRLDRSSALQRLVSDFDAALAGVTVTVWGRRPAAAMKTPQPRGTIARRVAL